MKGPHKAYAAAQSFNMRYIAGEIGIKASSAKLETVSKVIGNKVLAIGTAPQRLQLQLPAVASEALRLENG